MNFETTALFRKEAKKLAKKYPLLKRDLNAFIENFDKNHQSAVSIKQNLYKVRIKNSSKNRGKRAGYRVYYYLQMKSTVYLLTIYDKSETTMIDETVLDEIIREEIEI